MGDHETIKNDSVVQSERSTTVGRNSCAGNAGGAGNWMLHIYDTYEAMHMTFSPGV